MHRISLARNLALNAYWIGLSIKWNSIHNLILPSILLFYIPEDLKSTYLGLLTFAGLIIALVVQPLSGAVSDRWVSRWGRRRPVMIAGTLLEMLCLVGIAWAGNLWGLALAYLGLQLFSNISHGPAQGLLPDTVPPDQLGEASGVKNLMDMGGAVIASLLIVKTFTASTRQPVLPVLLIMGIILVSLAVTVFFTPEKPSVRPEGKRTPWRDLFRIDFRSHTAYWWLIAARFAFLLGIVDIQGFAQYYIRDVLRPPDPLGLTGGLLAVITLAIILFALISGWVGGRIGHRKVLFAAGFVAAAGCSLLFAARTPILLLAIGSILGAGVGLFLTSNWTLANQLAPKAESGKYLGLTNIATAGSGAVARLLGPGIDFFNNLEPGAFYGYLFLFLFGAVFTIVSSLLLSKVKAGSMADL